MDLNTKEKFIEIFRANGFTCIPIPKYADSVKEQKAADYRIKNRVDQPITNDENYAVIPTKGAGTCWLDFDHKELFRKFIEKKVSQGIMVIESPNGWHVPIKGLTGEIEKVFLYQSKHNSKGKPIIEILSHLQYVVGCGSDVFNFKADPPRRMFYENRGTERIFDMKGAYFEDMVDKLVTELKLSYASNKIPDRQGHYEMRKRFKSGVPPSEGTSNDYWYNAGVVVHTDNLSLEAGIAKVKEVYDKWKNKTRGWDNIVTKIKSAYEGRKLHSKGGRRKKEDEDELDSDIIANNIINERKIFSDVETKTIFENKDGYLINITNLLLKELGHDEDVKHLVTEGFFTDVKIKLISRADDIPPTNDDLKVFDNGIWDEKKKLLLSKDTDEIASMGFKGYNYLEPTVKNSPTRYMKLLFDNVPDFEIPRLKAALKSALTPRLDSRMTVIHGRSRVGKSAAMTILFSVLNRNSDYAMIVELSQMEDHFIKAHIIGKTLVVLSELPKNIKDWSSLKALTGESQKTERGFHKDAETFTNMIKIIATTNNIPKVPEEEKNAFYSARLSLVHNTRIEPYENTEDFEKDIVEEEGEKIISWIINMPEKECKYESKFTVEEEWEYLASPELEYMEKFWTYSDGAEPINVMRIVRDFQEKYQIKIPSVKAFLETLADKGYYINRNAIHDIIQVPQKEIPEEQKKI